MFNKVKQIINLLIHQIKIIWYKGDKYICPFCGYTSKSLSPIGLDIAVLKEKKIIGGGKRFAGCYNCGSSDRERLVFLYLKEKEKIFDTEKIKKILGIAPEKNLSKKLFNARFDEYICGDLFTEGYTYAKHVKNMNVLDMPFQGSTFDIVICNHVLEHITDDFSAMKEIKRILKSGGKAILQVPIAKDLALTFEDFSITNPKEREIIFGQFDHVRIYGQDYCERLKKSGFKVDEINISKEFSKYGLNEEENIFVCTK